jgi:hypothetical protein
MCDDRSVALTLLTRSQFSHPLASHPPVCLRSPSMLKRHSSNVSPARKQRATPNHFRLTRSARPDSPLHYAAFSFSFMMDFYLRTSRTEPSAVRSPCGPGLVGPVPALSSASGRSRDGRARPSVEVAGDFRRQPSRPSRVSRAPGPRATAFSRPINASQEPSERIHRQAIDASCATIRARDR